MSATARIRLGTLMRAGSENLDPRRFEDETFELYSIPAFDAGQPEVVRGRAIGSAKQVVAPGDVLLSRIVPHIRRSWVVGRRNSHRQIASGEWIVFRTCQAEPRYLRHLFMGDDFHERFMMTVAGVGGSLLRARPRHVAEIEIPLPILAEQRRIAAILDEADALRAKRRAALAQLDEMARAIFVEMFGDLRTNSRNWPLRPVGDYVAEFQGGRSIEADTDNERARHRVLKVSAVTSGAFRPNESKPLPDSYTPPAEHFVKVGDLLFSRANTTELVGAVAYVEASSPGLVLPDKLWRFVWQAPCLVEPLFVWALFQEPAIREEIGRRATGTSGSMKNISQAKLLSMPTILPPLQTQRTFVERLRGLMMQRTAQEAALAATASLFASLQHRAFRGEL